VQSSNSESVSDDTNLEQQPQTAPAEQIFFPVSILKLIVLNTLFFNLYSIFWMFMNWKYLKDKHGAKVLPGARAIFAPIFFFYLASDMYELIAKKGGMPPSLHPGVMGVIYLICNAVGRFDNPLCNFLSLFTTLPLVLLQISVNKLNGGEAAVTNKKFSVVNWIFMVIGGLLWILSLLPRS
jgi:hypothetical protein